MNTYNITYYEYEVGEDYWTIKTESIDNAIFEVVRDYPSFEPNSFECFNDDYCVVGFDSNNNVIKIEKEMK